MRRRLFPFGILLLAAALAGSATAGQRGGPPGVRGLEHRIESLELDDEVRAQALAIVDAASDEQRALRDSMREAHERLRALLEQDAPDLAEVEAQVEALGALHTQAHKQGLRTALEVAALLPADQRAQLFEKRHRGGHRGRWLH